MEEIRIGEYVRLKNGEIFKIDENTANYYISNKEFITNEIVKHSKNIIDLIEVGDYINGWKVLSIVTTYDKPNEIGIKLLGFDNLLYDVKIQSIVTKEQFKSVEYIVGDK